jgi:hypothetical protein
MMDGDALLQRMRQLVPSPENPTCECAGDRYCAYCLIADALREIERLRGRSVMTERQWSDLELLADIRELLRSIRDEMGDGYTVACGWDDEKLCLYIAKPLGIQRPWCMTLDEEMDYSRPLGPLITEFVTGAKEWFQRVS